MIGDMPKVVPTCAQAEEANGENPSET